MLHRRQSPFINVKLEIGDDSRRLTALPVDEIQQDLLLARLGMLSLNPCCDFLWPQFIDSERTGRSLPIESLG